MQVVAPAQHPRVNTGQIQAREAKVADLAVERLDQLTDLFIAVRDKGRAVEFEAGLRGRKRRKLTGQAAAAAALAASQDESLSGLDDFKKRYNDAQALQELDLSLPPLSPSPPPPSAAPIAPSPSKALPMSDVVNDSEDDPDADGEEEDEEMAVAESLAPPGVSVTTTAGIVTGGAVVKPPDVPVASTSNLAGSPSLEALKGVSPNAASPAVLPSPASLTPQPAPQAVNPALLGAAPSPAPGSSPQPPQPAATPFITPEPYHSVFGIHEISADYLDELPPVPHDVLRARMNTSLLLRANTKKSSKSAAASGAAALVQPDLYKLHVRAQHMGAQTFLGPGKRVHNTLSTHEWEVGVDEMRAIRAFERIEQLKQEKKWSFRQPKKQRVGVVPKAHWDHVLDEMRWMQIDFRQESRWKVVTAHKLARACRAWHRAGPDERASLCVRIRPPRFLGGEADAAAMEVEDEKEDAAPRVDKGKGKERAASQDADGEADADADADADGEDDAEGEADEGPSAGHATISASTSATPAPPVANAPPGLGMAGGSAGNEAMPLAPAGTLSRQQAAALEQQRQHAQAQHTFNLLTFRNPVFELDTEDTMVDPLVLAALRDSLSSDSSPSPSEEDPFLTYDLAALFPDLPLYSDFNVANDPALDRRVEDSSAWAGRLAHVTRLLESKPLLISTLQPGRTRTKDKWEPATAAVLEDIKEPVDQRETLPTTASALFAGRKPKDAVTGDLVKPPAAVPDADSRATSLLWLPEEDARLLALQKQYGFNWKLIAQVFNLSTSRPQSDYRLEWDCYDRWDKLVGPGSKKTLPDGTEIIKPPPEWIPPSDKFGRPLQVVGDGSKKKARHATILEAMKRVQKKRESFAAKQPPPGFPRRINMTMHESHNLPPRPNWTPMEWNIYKSEQEAQKLRVRQQQLAQQQVAQVAAQQQQQQPNGAARFPQQAGVPQGTFPAGQQPPRPPSSLPPPMAAAQAAARASPNGSPAALPPPAGSPSPAPAQLNGAPMQLPNGTVPGQTPQLSLEQLQMLQQRQRELLAAQARAVQAQAAANASAANGQGE
ncbi:hypothetical protein JCM10207_005282 [Rhodosporidiobolus poonsookiae]